MKKTTQRFKALSEEIRLRIMALFTEGELCVCDLMAALDLPQSTISRHLAYLRNAGLVTGERRGKWMYYQLTTGQDSLTHDLLELLSTHLPDLEVVKNDRRALVTYLAEKKTNNCT